MADRDKVDILKHSPIFSSLNDDELSELANLAVERKVMSSEFIFWEGDDPEWFYIVASGKVKVIKYSSLGKEFIIAFFDPGEMFGEIAVFEAAGALAWCGRCWCPTSWSGGWASTTAMSATDQSGGVRLKESARQSVQALAWVRAIRGSDSV